MFNKTIDLPLILQDEQDRVSITWEQLYGYCGPSQVIATTLGYRLFEQAFRELSPGQPPKREELAVLTAFPGRGILECIEVITRLPSLAPERLILDLHAGPDRAPASLTGRFYFEVQIDRKRRSYYPEESYFDALFLKQVKTWQNRDMTQEEYSSYMEYKWGKAQSLMDREGDLFVSEEIKPRSLPPRKEHWYGLQAYQTLSSS